MSIKKRIDALEDRLEGKRPNRYPVVIILHGDEAEPSEEQIQKMIEESGGPRRRGPDVLVLSIITETALSLLEGHGNDN